MIKVVHLYIIFTQIFKTLHYKCFKFTINLRISIRNKNINVSEHLDFCGKGHFTVIPLHKYLLRQRSGKERKRKHFIQSRKPSSNSDIATN